jgi:hypothetical protein
MNCPYCKYDIPQGATVCGHCGAYEKVVGTGCGFVLTAVPMLGTLLFGVVPAVILQKNLVAIGLFGLAFVVGYAVSRFVPRKRVWIYQTGRRN